MLRFGTTLSLLALASVAVVGCTDDTPVSTPTETTAYGTSSTIGGGSVRSFLKADASGNPIEIGLRISEATVNGVPANPPADPFSMEHMYHIALPAGAEKTAFQDISLDWGAAGHPPVGVYTTPHFDMHFYTVPMNERMTWVPNDPKLHILPSASLVPPMHATDSSGIPFMGLHYLDVTSPEIATGATFTSTFIWGYYNGQQAFLEPMITQAFLKAKTQFSASLKLPATYSRANVYYPTKYSVAFDDVTKEHVITLGAMVKR